MASSQISSIFFFFLCILLSAYFSSSETAFTSVSNIRLKNDAKNGDNRAKQTLKLQENYDSLLSTILIGNNLVNIAGSAIATVFFTNFSQTYGPTIATIVTTLFLLIFGEITPKLLAKIAPEQISKMAAPVLTILLFIFKPLVWLFGQWQKLIKRLIPFEGQEVISEEELLSLVDEARIDGSIEIEEHRLVKAAIEFDDVEVSNIITPRVDVVAVDLNDPVEEIEATFDQHSFSRVIVYEDDIDNVVGVLHLKDFNRFLKAKTNNRLHFPSIINMVSDVLFVPPVMSLSNLMETMQKQKNHMAIVVDEYGGMLGIVTMEDALEELVGEIWDETDVITTEVTPVVEGQVYDIKGSYSLDKFFDDFNIVSEDEWLSNSVSGFVLEVLGEIPDEGRQFEYNHLSFTVLKADSKRIVTVRVEKLGKMED